jgi:hypothetical protein
MMIATEKKAIVDLNATIEQRADSRFLDRVQSLSQTAQKEGLVFLKL